jgi:uncharacterized protein YbjT (DUF2867 family)
MNVLLLGSTGLVGSFCLSELLKRPEVEQLVLPVRTLPPSPVADVRVRYVCMDFSRLADHADSFMVDTVLCCLGSTRRKAGSRKNFEKIDVTFPLMAAALAKKQGAKSFGIVSAQGANSHSLFFYNRCKGLLEQGLRMLDYPSLTIARPSLLLGKRQESRPLEALAQTLARKALPLIPAFWRPVGAEQVARALVAHTLAAEPGVRILYNRPLTNY